MKIAFDHQIFTFQKYGGISRYITRLSENLNSIGWQAQILTTLHKNYYLQEINNDNFDFVWNYPDYMNITIGTINKWFAKYKMANWQPDILHETFYLNDQFISDSIPVVTTVHDMIPELFQDDSSKENKYIENKKRAINRADHVICVSHNTKADLIELYNVPEVKVSVVHHGFERFSSKTDTEFDNTQFFDSPFLLYVGNRKGYKNFEKFVKAYASSSMLKNDFEVIAFGGSNFSSREKELLKDLDILEKVKQMSGNDQLLGKLYSNASAFVFPSLYEGFGMPILEAMAHNCPVIASNKSSIPEVAGKAAELFEPEDLDSIRSSLEKVLYSLSYKNELIEKGVKHLNCFSWVKCAKETINVYEEVLAC